MITTVASKINWKYVIIGLLVLALIMYIYFSGKKAGKQGKPNIVPLPNDLMPNGMPIQIDGAKIRQISIAIYDDMNGYNWGGHNYEPYRAWSQMSDTEFVAVYNDFNQQYNNLGKGTLKEWLIDEVFTTDNIVDGTILPRMAKHNLV